MEVRYKWNEKLKYFSRYNLFHYCFKKLTSIIFREKVKDKFKETKKTIKRPEIYKPFGFLIVIFGLLELSGFAVLANYSIIMVQVKFIYLNT